MDNKLNSFHQIFENFNFYHSFIIRWYFQKGAILDQFNFHIKWTFDLHTSMFLCLIAWKSPPNSSFGRCVTANQLSKHSDLQVWKRDSIHTAPGLKNFPWLIDFSHFIHQFHHFSGIVSRRFFTLHHFTTCKGCWEIWLSVCLNNITMDNGGRHRQWQS